MILNKIITAIKRKLMEPKVYSILFKTGNGNIILVMHAAYSLEEAYQKARDSKAMQDPKWQGALIHLFISGTIDDLFGEYIVMNSSKSNVQESVVDTKNQLMQEILKAKDTNLLESNKATFSDVEYKYLLAEIKKK